MDGRDELRDEERLTESDQKALLSMGISNTSDIAAVDWDNYLVTLKSGQQRRLVDVYTRVMGYHSVLSRFNIGKQQEHADRVHYTERKAYYHTDFGVIEVDRPFCDRES